jgi:hypothetical protein
VSATNSISINDELKYSSLQDSAGNVIDIPDEFEFYTCLKIGEGFFDKAAEQDVFSIVTTSGKKYKVTFDTRVYDNSIYQINGNYLAFRLYKDDQLLDDNIINSYDLLSNFITMSQFEYAFGTSLNDTGVYFIEDNEND